VCPDSGNSSNYEDCKFMDNPNQQGSFASVKYKAHLPQVKFHCFKPVHAIDLIHFIQVVEFCDDGVADELQHNQDAPNRQNLRCKAQSVWEVCLCQYIYLA
jgi:hypothetical protein